MQPNIWTMIISEKDKNGNIYLITTIVERRIKRWSTPNHKTNIQDDEKQRLEHNYINQHEQASIIAKTNMALIPC